MTDKQMYPDDGGLKEPVRSWEQVRAESIDHLRGLFGLPPKNQPFLPLWK